LSKNQSLLINKVAFIRLYLPSFIFNMTDYIISGIQQVGIGVPDVQLGFDWYRKYFGMDIPVFDEAAEANLMLPYTGNMPHQRRAILSLNLRGGGGFEIWQYTSRTPVAPSFKPALGDIGIFVCKMKSVNVRENYRALKGSGAKLLSDIVIDPAGQEHFFVEDLFGNVFDIIEFDNWFGSGTHYTGGPCGVTIGVSNIDRSIPFYRDILGYDKIIYEVEGEFKDFKFLNGGERSFRRILMTHSKKREGSFSKLLGRSVIELVELKNIAPRKIFDSRFWGDLGYIHLCFDVKNMPALKQKCANFGSPFTVDSGNKFEMGEAAGHFSYVEDPDGTLIEFVETFKVPILKKINWYLDLRKRNPENALPDWMLKSMSMNRVKG
jgi:catechol 2,3-dioxygenase-like lactoylglutathione lyase family enzyme